jgi:hypothetical protein
MINNFLLKYKNEYRKVKCLCILCSCIDILVVSLLNSNFSLNSKAF